MPDEAQCSICGLWDVEHPMVKQIAAWRAWQRGFALASLTAMVACECPMRAAKREKQRAQRYADANLPHAHNPRTFENLDGSRMSDALGKAHRFASLDGPRCLLLVGQTGTGKSHILESIGRSVLDAGWTARYDTASAFLDRLRHTFGQGQTESVTDVLNWYSTRTVLLLDDLGSRAEKDWAVQELTDLVDFRIRNGGWLAVATNLVRDEMAEAVGDRLASRLFQTNESLEEVCRVTLTCGDYRRQ